MRLLRAVPIIASVIGISMAFTSAYAETVDTSLLPKTTSTTAPNFTPKTFSSCADMRTQIADFMEMYYEKNPPNYYKGGGIIAPMVDAVNDSTTSGAAGVPKEESSKDTTDQDYSKTNTRTIGVDEPDTVKTDGKYLYTARIQDKAIYIHEANDTLKSIAKIVLPEEFTSTELLLDGNRLIVIAEKYVHKAEYSTAWIDRTQKTVVAVYDIRNRSKPLLERYSQIDGYLREARLDSGKLTLVTSTYFNFPYDRYFPQVKGQSLELDIDKLTSEFSTKNVIPKRIDFAIGKKSADITAEINRARSLYQLNETDASTCTRISYILPDEATLESYNFSPTFTAITQISVRSAASKPTTNLLFGDVSKVYLAGSGNLYLSTQLYSGYNNACPPGAMCIMRWIPPTIQTVLHKYSTISARAQYQRSALIPGSLISDYAIDEGKNAEVRLVTQKTGEDKESIVTVLNSSFEQLGALTGLGKTENFQSARFIGDRLYLVTFKQIDPFFVIDMSDSKNPKVLGELKIPGYSTYLHPYDENRLIGIGYDTKENAWGGIQNGGIKIDLYNVSDVAHPKQEGTLTLGGMGSSSDALSNPRLFVWRKTKNTLYLPANLTTPLSLDRPYDYADYFQGMVAIKIDPTASQVVQEVGRTTHISWDDAILKKELTKECAQYIPTSGKVCRKLISGEEICTDSSPMYVPNYCYQDAGLGTYKASKIWEQYSSFIDRVMYSQNRVFTFSRARIESISDEDFSVKGKVNLPVKMTNDQERIY